MPDTGLRGLPLLDAVIAHIEAHPETWDQGDYRCSTGMCVAGWAAELAGGTWVSSDSDGPRGEWLTAEPGDNPGDVDEESDYGPMVHAAERAARLFGFSRYLRDGRDLFASYNTLADIKVIRDEIAARLAGGQP